MSLPPPLDQLAGRELATLEASLTTVHFSAGSRLFRAGSPGDSLYIIDQGSVRVQLDRPELESDGVIAYVDKGMVLGELAILDQKPRSASAYADTDVEARRIRAEDLERLGKEHPEVALAVLRAVGRNAALSLRDATDRLASAVFRESHPDVDDLVARARAAFERFCDWPEKRVDALLLDLASRVAQRARYFAEITVAATRIGDVEDKTIKNRMASLGVVKGCLGKVALGPIDNSDGDGITDLASPMGWCWA
jgi:CRP-like cAMP-binding protein